MHPMAANSTTTETDVPMSDLSPLAWVLYELRKSLEGATKALKRFAWDAEMARGSDLAAINASQLRVARQQLFELALRLLEPVQRNAHVHMVRRVLHDVVQHRAYAQRKSQVHGG